MAVEQVEMVIVHKLKSLMELNTLTLYETLAGYDFDNSG
jgi:hypothetical protein